MKKLNLLLLAIIWITSFAGVHFNGSDEWMDCGDNIEPLNAVTVCGWWEFDDANLSNTFVIVSKGYGGSSPYISYGLYVTSAEKAQFFLGTSAGFKQGVTGHVLSNNTIYFSCGRWKKDTTDVEIRLYNNEGTLLDSDTDPAGSLPIIYSTESLGIARGRAGDPDYSKGTFYEIGIWSTDLTNAEMETIAKSGMKNIMRQIQPNYLRFHLPLDDIPNDQEGHNFQIIDKYSGVTCTGNGGAGGTGIQGEADRFLYSINN